MKLWGWAAALAAAAVSTAGVAPAGAATVKAVEGTELRMRLEETISSKLASEGDRFTVTLAEDVALTDGVVLRAGYRGVGEVLDARKNGALGKTGKLTVSLLYLKVGDQRVRLRATRAAQGDHRTGAQVATGVLLLPIWPIAGAIKGKNTQIRQGTVITAYVERDTLLETPLEPPPGAAP